ncbi:MAG: 30S ribosomal protein S6 [Deltaproteobacteria bacterium]|jgi:small subunit ribosomal protein S6|nr:30S ribosomal protein S6 [Deltaproteobacteria bacterium]MBK9371749.1 30S ribosomal protein S6 [Deltaproteobacteria bacterium]MBK9644121.1 30S ribosomal protein S6 [Deltaproteobacteria bacterium]MCK6518678.1 30S ribosomal protein S6 [Myxococcota bacterium]
MIYTEYETIYILKPEVPEDIVRTLNEKVDGIIGRYEGHILIRDDWGKRKLAYPIQKNSKGHYLYVNYLGPSDLVLEVERNLRIEENLLRFLTVKLSEDVDVETKQQEAKERIARKAQAAAERESDDDYDDDLDDMDMDDDG